VFTSIFSENAREKINSDENAREKINSDENLSAGINPPLNAKNMFYIPDAFLENSN